MSPPWVDRRTGVGFSLTSDVGRLRSGEPGRRSRLPWLHKAVQRPVRRAGGGRYGRDGAHGGPDRAGWHGVSSTSTRAHRSDRLAAATPSELSGGCFDLAWDVLDRTCRGCSRAEFQASAAAGGRSRQVVHALLSGIVRVMRPRGVGTVSGHEVPLVLAVRSALKCCNWTAGVADGVLLALQSPEVEAAARSMMETTLLCPNDPWSRTRRELAAEAPARRLFEDSLGVPVNALAVPRDGAGGPRWSGSLPRCGRSEAAPQRRRSETGCWPSQTSPARSGSSTPRSITTARLTSRSAHWLSLRRIQPHRLGRNGGNGPRCPQAYDTHLSGHLTATNSCVSLS